jgi:hypothetical protein
VFHPPINLKVILKYRYRPAWKCNGMIVAIVIGGSLLNHNSELSCSKRTSSWTLFQTAELQAKNFNSYGYHVSASSTCQ